MGTFVTAYLIVWLAVAGYVVRLGLRQRKLLRALELLERTLPTEDEPPASTRRAA